MRLASLALALAVASAATSVAWAGPKDPGYYLSFRIPGGVAEVDEVQNESTFSGTPGNPDEDDLTVGGTGVFGYTWKSLPIRTEFEYTHIFRFDYDASPVILNPGAGGQQGLKSNIKSDIFLVNAFYDFDTGTSFYPYVGGGAGYGRHTAETELRNLASFVAEERDDDESGLVWAVQLGVHWAFSEHWDAELGFRYIDLGEVVSGPFTNGTKIRIEDYTSKDLILGLRYRF